MASKILPLTIAMVAHAANNELRRSLGQPVVEWGRMTKEEQEQVVAGVRYVQGFMRDGYTPTPEQCHASWYAQKVADGWHYGPEKDAAKKTHPNMVAYASLPEDERRKDALFLAIVVALSPETGGIASWEGEGRP